MKKDTSKTKVQLISELQELRNKLKELQEENNHTNQKLKNISEKLRKNDLDKNDGNANYDIQKKVDRITDSETRLKNLFNLMTDIVFEMDYNGTYLNIAPTSPTLMYRPADEAIGKTIHEVFPKDQADTFLNFIQNCINKNKADKIIYPIDFEDNTIWFEGRANPIGDNKILYIASDITDRKITEEKLITERNLFSKGPVFIIEWDATENWPVKYVSDNIYEILGYRPEQLMDESFRYADLMHPDDIKRVDEEIENYIANKVDSYEQSYRLRHKNGSYLWMYDVTKLIKNKKNEVTQFRGYLFDQTKLKTAQSEIELQKYRLSNVLEGTNAGTWEWNVQTGQTIFNEHWAKMLGYSLSELEPTNVDTWKNLTHPDDLKTCTEKLQDHFNGNTDFYSTEFRMKHKDGYWIWLLDHGRVKTWTKDGKPLWMYGTHTDISERKHQELLMKSRLHLLQFATNHNTTELLEETLNELESLTKSKIGFFHLVESDQKTLSLQAWSTSTKEVFCKAIGEGLHYSIDQAGVWVDCVHQLKPVIHNDYNSLKHRKGLPDGHTEIKRELVVPIFRDGKITAIAGVGNKPVDYVQQDVDTINLIADMAWEMVELKQAEEALNKNELLLSNAANIAKLGPWEIDIKSGLFTFNDAFYKIYNTNADREGGYNMSIADFLKRFIHPEDLQFVSDHITKAIKAKEPNYNNKLEHRIKYANGETGYISVQYYVIKDSRGKNIKAFGVNQDITQRKVSEIKLQQSEERFRLLAENIPGVIYMCKNDEKWTMLFINERVKELTGYDHKMFSTNEISFADLYHPDDIEEIYTKVDTALKNNTAFHLIYRLKHKNGKWIWVEEIGVGIYENSKVITIEGFLLDITDRKHDEVKLEALNERIALATDSVKFGIWDLDLLNNILTWDNRMFQLYGFDKKDFEGAYETWKKGVHPDDLEKADFEVQQAIKGEKDFDTDFRVVWPNNEVRHLKANAQVIRNESGIPFRMIGINFDITDLKKAEQELMKLSTATTQSPSMIVITDLKGKLEYVNPKFSELTGYSREEAIGQSSNILKSGKHSNDIYKELWHVISNGNEWHGEFLNKKKNGDIYWEKASISPVKDSTGNITNYVKIGEDITEQKKNQQIQSIIHNISNAVITSFSLRDFIELVKNEISKIIDTTNFSIALLDESEDMFDLIYHKDSYDKITSFPAGKTFTAYVAKTKKPLLATRRISNKLIESGEVEMVGTPSKIWLGLPLLHKGRILGVMALQSYESEQEFNESDVRILEIISHQISVSLERKKSEDDLKRALEKAQESDRLKTAFLTNMSHEIRTPMNGILGFTSLLSNHKLSGKEQKEYIKIIEKSGQRMLSTINDIIDISRIEAGLVEIAKTEIYVNSTLTELFEFFNIEAKEKGIELLFNKYKNESDIIISSDKLKFEGILINLIKNAIKFTHKGKVEFGYVIKNNTIEFFVKDTGVGIPSDRISAIFNRFEQADIEDTRVFEGSGLGLSICKSYAEMLDGDITVSSVEGSGTIFKLKLPLNNNKSLSYSTNEHAINEVKSDLSNLTVIIAEDDEINKHFFEIILKGVFKKTIFTTTGRETIELCRNLSDTDLILMDIKMPDISGFVATQEIRKFNKDVIIIAQTAYVNTDIEEKALAAGCNDYIAKPINKEELLIKIKKYFK